MVKSKKVYIVTSFLIYFLLFVLLFGSKIFSNKVENLKNIETRSASTIDINWEKIYPYSKTIEEISINDDVTKNESYFDTYCIITKMFENIGANCFRYFYWYSDVARIGYILASKLTNPATGNGYIKLNNGYWTVQSPNGLLVRDAKEQLAPYISLSRYLKSEGIDFIFFYPPNKDCRVDNEYPSNITSHINDNIDVYLSVLDEYGVDYVDMRQNVHKEGLEHYALFYKTDHHWTLQAGLWAADVISDEISKKTDIMLPRASDLGSYRTVTYENAEFGSYGEAVTRYIAEPEDFSIAFPEFDTKYRLEIPSKELDVIGSFENVFIDYDKINKAINQNGGPAYGSILYGNQPYLKISNLYNPNGPKVLMIRDSFAIAVAPYLIGSCSEIVMLDTRPGNGCFTGSIVNCIDDYNPDIVISLQFTPQMIALNKKLQ